MRRGAATLAVLCAAQFLVVLDITAVTTALPSLRDDLGLSPGRLHWAVSAYAVVFGGVLLVAGRLADLRGARRVFVAGVAVFGVFSLASGLAWSGGSLGVARALQGCGAALISPAALALLVRRFPGERGRAAALGVWGAVGALAAASGALVGGAAVALLDWRWIFLVNVPVAVLALACRRLLPCDPPPSSGRIDLAGALLATAALMLLAAALSEAALSGTSAGALALGGAAAGAGMAAIRRQRRSPSPLVPAGALRSPGLVSALAAGFLHGAMMLATFLLLVLYMQEVLGMSALAAGAGLVATRGVSVLVAPCAGRLVGAVGAGAPMVAAMAAMTGALALLARAPTDGSYARDLLPPLLVLGVAIPVLFLTINVAALRAAPRGAEGLASGLLTTAQWVGGALGAAAAGAVAGGAGAGGIAAGFWLCAAAGVAGTALAATLARRAAGDQAPAGAPARTAAAARPSGAPSAAAPASS